MNKQIKPSGVIHIPQFYVISPLVISLALYFGYLPKSFADTSQFSNIAIQSPFKAVLIQHPDFMKRGGARIFDLEDGNWVLIGIAKFIPLEKQRNNLSAITRIGEIKARAAILEYMDGVEVSVVRENTDTVSSTKNKKTSLSSFLQVTESSAAGHIEQMPVIGTWRGENGNIYYVAVGISKNSRSGPAAPEKEISGRTQSALPSMSGDPFFIRLLEACPLFAKHGGVRCFVFKDGGKAILSIASARIKNSRVKARTIARLKAIRGLLGYQKGVEIVSVDTERLGETLKITESKTRHTMLSDFLSVQEEKVAGYLRAMPVVAEWEDMSGGVYWVAVGKAVEPGGE